MLIGPSAYNFADADRKRCRPAPRSRCDDAAGLAREAARLLLDPAAARRMGEAGIAFCAAHRGALAKVLELIKVQRQ